MKLFLKTLFILTSSILVSACSVFGDSGVEIAPYNVLEKSDPFEIRHYESLVLVTTPMNGLEGQKSPFYKLFNYISGENNTSQEIAMTAPVFMDQKETKSETMSFVLPKDFSIKEAPVPQNPSVKLEEITDYTVATITFNGRLKQENIETNKKRLEAWIEEKNLKVTGAAKAAGYNPPFTIPAFRRNEILISIKKP